MGDEADPGRLFHHYGFGSARSSFATLGQVLMMKIFTRLTAQLCMTRIKL